MKYKTVCFLAAAQIEAQKLKTSMAQTYPHTDAPEDADVLVAIGGDGFMLETLHNFMGLNKPIFGINRGSVGFLMNELGNRDLMSCLNRAHKVILHPLHMHARTVDGEDFEALAFNEVSLLRQTRQTANIRIKIDGKVRLEKLVCDGVLLSTPAGSTAYNLSAHGPIIPIKSNLLALTPISAFRPRRWRGALLPHTAKVELGIIDCKKRPVSAVADSAEIRDVIQVRITEDRTIGAPVLFDPDHNLEERILNEQFF